MTSGTKPGPVHHVPCGDAGKLEVIAGADSDDALAALPELKAIGEASPTDAELTRRMGWTRQRISKALEELEAEELVSARDERQWESFAAGWSYGTPKPGPTAWPPHRIAA